MNKLGPCPKCGSKQAFVIDQALIPNYEYKNSIEALTLTAAYTETGERGLLGVRQDRVVVRIEARVCADCAYTELYTKDLDVLARFASQQLGNVRRVTID